MRITTIIVGMLFFASMWMLYSAVGMRIDAATVPALAIGSAQRPFVSGTMFFVGDVMLGRNVELLMEEHGPTYPFRGSAFTLGNADVTVANLEGPVPEVHVPTRMFRFVFSMQDSVLPIIRSSGIDVLSLANNHAFDQGIAGFLHTQKACGEAQLRCVGDPSTVRATTTTVVQVGSTRVGLVFLHTLEAYPDTETMAQILNELASVSDIQITYIHWGDEYVLTHSPQQEAFAHVLIDNGIDAVVGHHPHVIADIALYNGKPIFYSLGNFIFDQYFSDDVMTHLGVDMKIHEDEITYTLVPFSSKVSRSAPELLEGDEGVALISRILAGVATDPAVDMDRHTITIQK